LITAATQGYRNFAVADFNGDTILDVAAHYYNDVDVTFYIDVLSGKGDGTFVRTLAPVAAEQNPFQPSSADKIGGIVVADLNRDGRPDVVAADPYGSPWYINQGGGVLVRRPPPEEWALELSDLDGDGKADSTGASAYGVQVQL